MNVYVLYGNDMFDKEGNCSVDKEYIASNESYSNERFKEICARAKENCKKKYNEVSLYYMVEILINLYGFEKINIRSGYEL